MVTISFQIPDELAEEAEAFDLLREDILSALITEELERRIMNLVNTEVHAHRADKKASAPKSDED